MTRASLYQSNFTAGEISPRLYGRVDIARYQNGVKRMENAVPLIHGGAVRRDGLRYIAGAKFNAQKCRLVPFVFSNSQAYVLEFGHLYLRVYRNGAQVLDGGLPYEIATPYTEAMLPDLDWTQGADTMFIAQPSLPIHTLKRFADDLWTLAPAAFTVLPFETLGHRFAEALTLSDATVGTGRTFTSAGAIWLAGDIGRQIVLNGGIATITNVTPTVATANIVAAFTSTTLPANAWTLADSPQVAITPGVSAVAWTGTEPATSITLSNATVGAGRVATRADGNHVAADIGKEIHSDGGIAIITAIFGLPDEYQVDIKVAFPGTTLASGNWALESRPVTASSSSAATKNLAGETVTISAAADAWRAVDVGSFIRLNGGVVKITQFTNAQSVAALVISDITANVTAAAGAWSLDQPLWSDTYGYPRTVTLFEQRLIAAGSTSFPQTLWGSRTGAPLDFTLGTLDDDGFAFEIASDQVNPIVYVSAFTALVALTYSGEFTLTGGTDQPLTPTNVRIKPQSEHGSATVRPVQIGGELCFVQRAGRKLRTMAYRFDTDAYTAPDIAVLAEHITAPGVVEAAFQQEPESLLWLLRSDGVIATLTLSRDQDVIGWARQISDGVIESLASIPNASGDEVWALVRRTVGAATVRYVERFEASVLLDAAITGTHPTGATVWAGLTHLEGRSVECVADGVFMGAFTVTGGQITLPRDALAVVIGLPYTTTIELLTPELQTGQGTAQGNAMGTFETSLRFLDTVGAKLNGSVIPFRNLGPAVLDQPVAPYSGLYRIERLGFNRGEDEIVITQDQPLPFHLLAVVRKLVAND